jgi:hypothetical protein
MPRSFRATSMRRPLRPGGSIRERLRHHLRGEAGACTRAATEFDYEAATDALSLYRHYLAVYLGTSAGRLPDCNH